MLPPPRRAVVRAASAKPRCRFAHARDAASWAAAWLLGLLLVVLPSAHAAAAVDEVNGGANTAAAAAASASASLLPPHAIEELFASTINAESARANLKRLTSVPHQAGSVGDLELAKFVQRRFQEYGVPIARLEAFPALLSYPGAHRPVLQLVDADNTSRVLFAAGLAEPVVAEDVTSDTFWRNHTYLGYSPAGEATAELVYANYGRPEDFDVLAEAGVEVAGRIVLVRYGRCFRGLKVWNAQERGAVGVLIYSDPAEDGFAQGNTYPEGPWRPEFGVQRGSSAFMSLCTGDPARAASRQSVKEICGYDTDELRPSIPALPISYADARPLLASLQGPTAPPDFQGGLDLPYRLGPGADSRVRLATFNREFVSDIWNVLGVLPSPDYGKPGDRVVLLSNHRDAWVFGAVDPNSGTSALLEVAKGLGTLWRLGWRPQRTIVLGSWSGEELGLIGSTHWGESNAAELSRKAVAVLNCDSAVSGPFVRAEATPTLRSLIRATQADVAHPAGGVIANHTAEDYISILGSGSDYTVFVHHLGITSLDTASVIDPRAQYGQYHSIFDSFHFMEKHADPTFGLHAMMAEYWGKMALRIADAKVLPFNHTDQALALRSYVTDLEALLARKNRTTALDLRALRAAVALYADAAEAVAAAASAALLQEQEESVQQQEQQGGREAVRARLGELNDRLAFTERRFLSPAGLPRRPWFKHVGQAPGLYLGYGAESLPGVTQAVNDGKMALAQEQVLVAAWRITDAALYLAGREGEQGEEEEGVVEME